MKGKSLLVVVSAYVVSGAALAAPDTTKGSWYGTNGLDGVLRGRDVSGNPVNLLNGDVPNPVL